MKTNRILTGLLLAAFIGSASVTALGQSAHFYLGTDGVGLSVSTGEVRHHHHYVHYDDDDWEDYYKHHKKHKKRHKKFKKHHKRHHDRGHRYDSHKKARKIRHAHRPGNHTKVQVKRAAYRVSHQL